MENVVLGLLILQGLTLYELNQAFKQGISLFYSASYGSLQTAIKQLLRKGMIAFEEKVEQGRNKKIYTITESGRQAFFAWMLEEIPPNKLEVTALSRVYFLGLMPGDEQKRQVVGEILAKIELVQCQLSAMQEQLSQLQVPEAFQAVFTYQLKTLDYGLKAHVFAREWFEDLLKSLATPDGSAAGQLH